MSPPQPGARLDGYFLVGIIEELPLTISLMAGKTGNEPSPVTPHLNPSLRESYDLDPEAIGHFREKNALDYEIHRYASERLRREDAGA